MLVDLSTYKLKDLKEETYEAWKLRHFCTMSVDLSTSSDSPDFKQEIKKTFGDLRKKTTWANAYASLFAKNAADGYIDAFSIILYSFSFKEGDWNYGLRHLLIDKFLEIPDSLELLKMGFEQLLGLPLSTEEKESAHGLLELLGESAAGTTRGFATRFVPTALAPARAH